jgi:hypothetical protein
MIECSNSDSLNDANAVTFERAQGAYDRVDAAATSARMLLASRRERSTAYGVSDESLSGTFQR